MVLGDAASPLPIDRPTDMYYATSPSSRFRAAHETRSQGTVSASSMLDTVCSPMRNGMSMPPVSPAMRQRLVRSIRRSAEHDMLEYVRSLGDGFNAERYPHIAAALRSVNNGSSSSQ